MYLVLEVYFFVDDHDDFLLSVIFVMASSLSKMLVWLSSLLHRRSVCHNDMVFDDCR